MLDRLKLQPALLKLDLYCRGARLDDSCFIEGDGGRKVLRTRAGLGSGLEVILPGDRSHPEMWTNVPVSEAFAAHSPYSIHRVVGSGGRSRYLLRREGRDVTPIRLAPRPAWRDVSAGARGEWRRDAQVELAERHLGHTGDAGADAGTGEVEDGSDAGGSHSPLTFTNGLC